MSVRRKNISLRLAFVVLAVAALGLLLRSEGGTRPEPTRIVVGDGPFAGPFTISGSVTGLYPSAHKMLPLSISNTNPYALAITSLSVVAGPSDHVGCGAANVTSPGFSGAVVVPASSATVINVPVDMVVSPPNSCQGATFPLTYSGAGVRTPLPTTLKADPVVAQLGTPTKITFGQFSAVLTVTGTVEPVAGKTVTFSVMNNVACQAVTNAAGRATCGGLIPSINALLGLKYVAQFSGDTTYEPATATASVLVVLVHL